MKIPKNPPAQPPISPWEREQREKLKEVAQKFEAVFVNQMVGSMRKTVSRGGLVPESQAEKVFRGMLDQQHAEKISQSDQLGLSQMIYDHLLRMHFRR